MGSAVKCRERNIAANKMIWRKNSVALLLCVIPCLAITPDLSLNDLEDISSTSCAAASPSISDGSGSDRSAVCGSVHAPDALDVQQHRMELHADADGDLPLRLEENVNLAEDSEPVTIESEDPNFMPAPIYYDDVEPRMMRYLKSLIARVTPTLTVDAKVRESLPDFISKTDWTEIGQAILEVLVLLLALVRALTTLWMLILRPIMMAVVTTSKACFPHVRYLSEALWSFLMEQDPKVLAACAGGLGLIEFIRRQGYIGRLRTRVRQVRQNIRRRYLRLSQSVREKSRVAAAALPHVLFFIPIVASLYFLPAVLYGISPDSLIVYIPGFYYPLVRSVLTLNAIREQEGRLGEKEEEKEREVEENEEQTNKEKTGAGAKAEESMKSKRHVQSKQQREYQRALRSLPLCLQYWVVLAVFCAVGRAMETLLVFVPSRLQPSLQGTGPLWAVLFFWLQFPGVEGSTVIYRILVPIVNRHVTVAVPTVDSQQSNFLLNMLVTIGVLTNERRDMLSDLLAHSGYLLLGFFFFFTPSFLTYLGTLLIAYCIPAYSAMKVLNIVQKNGILLGGPQTEEKKKSPSKGGEVTSPASSGVLLPIVERWLRFFVVLFVFEYFHDRLSSVFGWLPLWYHTKLAILLWLQLPYFNGAQRLYETTVAHIMSLRRVIPR